MTPAPGDSSEDAPGSLQARIAALRSTGAWRLDPARFRFLESLGRRLGEQPEAVRRLLEHRLQSALAAYTARASAPDAGPAQPPLPAAPASGIAPLAALNRYIGDAARASRTGEGPFLGEAPPTDELASARRFRQAWASRRRHDQVAQAAARRPLNAGPLNSHGLVLQSLARMEELSPHYLEAFVMHVEALQWLAKAGDKLPDAKGKAAVAARRSRPKK